MEASTIASTYERGIRMRKKIAAAFAAATLLTVGTAAAGTREKENDVVFADRNSQRGPDYVEVFKKEGTSGKNYLYTVTQIVTPGGMYCTVITFSSETAGTATCLNRSEVANPDAFRPLKPELFPDVKPS